MAYAKTVIGNRIAGIGCLWVCVWALSQWQTIHWS